MSALTGLDIGDTVVEDKDTIGSTFGVVETAIYPLIIHEAYVKVANSGALGVHLTLTQNVDGTGQTVEKDVYISSGTEKGGKSYWTDKDGENHPLPGYLFMDSLVQIIAGIGKRIQDIPTTKMITQIYDFDAKERLDTEVDMLEPLMGKPIYVGIEKQLVDKRMKDEKTGKYVTAGGFREENELLKVWRAADKKSVDEIKADNDKPASFYHIWDKRFTGKTRDRRSKGNKVEAPVSAGEAKPGKSGMFPTQK